MYFNEKDGDRMIDGVPRHNVVQRSDGRIEIWDEECETQLGSLPAGNWTPNALNAVCSFYRNGHKAGTAAGEARAQRAMRMACGLDH